MCKEELVHVDRILQSGGIPFGDAPAGVRLLAVGSGAPGVAVAVLREQGLLGRWTAIVDPSLAAYRAIGAHRGVMRTFTFRRWDNMLGLCLFPVECCKGRLPFVTAGDPWQQGGVVVAGGGGPGDILYLHRETNPGYPPISPAKLLGVLKAPSPAAGASPAVDPAAVDTGVAK
jgi:hypothetical protein